MGKISYKANIVSPFFFFNTHMFPHFVFFVDNFICLHIFFLIICNRDPNKYTIQCIHNSNGDGETNYFGCDNGQLRCNSHNVNSNKEKFYMDSCGGNCYGFRSVDSGKYIGAQQDPNHLLKCDAPALGPWEQFDVQSAGTCY